MMGLFARLYVSRKTLFEGKVTTRIFCHLFKFGQFEVVERRSLDKSLEEQKLTMSGLVEAESVQKLGSILGVKAIVSGTVTDLESAVKINARIIAADTGSLLTAAGVSMKKDADVKRLMDNLITNYCEATTCS